MRPSHKCSRDGSPDLGRLALAYVIVPISERVHNAAFVLRTAVGL
jgi:hypothetical protein